MPTLIEKKVAQDKINKSDPHWLEQQQKIMRARYFQELDLIAQQERDKNNVCPHCHIVLPLNGKCDCGYKK